MKRYDNVSDYTFEMVEMLDGDYVLYSDVERETIPRPDPDEARKAVEELLEEASMRYRPVKSLEESDAKFKRIDNAYNRVLRLMGVR